MKPLRILLVEDNADDEILVSRELRKGGIEFSLRRTDSGSSFHASIQQSPPDLVISDYTLPMFSGLEALKLLKDCHQDVPFILLSGTVGEATAIEAIQAGADDYVLKHNLIRLVPAVTRAVNRADERRRARASEQDLRESRQRLLESELRYRSIVEDQTEMILRFDLDGRITFANKAYCDANQATVEQVTGKYYYSRIHPDDQERVRSLVADADIHNPGHASESRACRPDGSIVWESWTGRALYGANGEHCGFQAVGRDITRLVEMQRKLLESEQQYRSIVEDQREMIVRFDRNGAITFANHAYAATWGRLPEQLLGQSCFSRIHPDDQATARQRIARISCSEPFSFMQFRVVHEDGEITWAEWNGRGLYDENGQLLGYQAVGRDITALRMAEKRLREKELQLTHLARVSALGEMVAGISHEINQPLAAISNFSAAMQLMLQHETLTEVDIRELHTWAGRICHQTRRISEIIFRLRRFGGPGSQREEFALSEAISEALLVTETRTRFAVDQVCVDCPSILPATLADRVQIEQVIVNLIRNACDAMAGLPIGSRRLTIHVLESGGMITTQVRDTGPGIAKEDENRIFEAFVTSRKEGMGLGLAISRTIIESHGGRIRAVPGTGGGCLEFTLPVSPSSHE